ncbi:acyl-CoA desaturase-like [Centruroides sculpturatus]|uniref:acyl-CoA desaturase-like n=1 Tax=Centruroides sculpturatus TaxID=218467 RepID=UPI000C6D5588|nr:acyl-CoA desaturase-like [Centruroides sculpturatus]
MESKILSTKTEIVWRSVLVILYLHLAAIFGLYFTLFKAKWQTNAFNLAFAFCAGLGITAGAHRLWCHKSYKAKLPLRILLAIFNCMAMQTSIYEWCRDHRMHHTFSETDADPHNASRGFFFSHVGWLMVRKHPEVIKKGENVYFDDILSDPVVRIQKRFYIPLAFLLGFVIPICLPILCWQEASLSSYHVCMLRYVVLLNSTWFVNSLAHHYGQRPYNKHINPRENLLVSLLAIGEGFHNYHHTFPWDYSTSELGWFFNFSTFFIDMMAAIGLAFDLKTVSKDQIQKVKEKSQKISKNVSNQ